MQNEPRFVVYKRRFSDYAKKNPHFNVFRGNKRNLSVYLSYFVLYLLIKRNFSAYLANGCLTCADPLALDAEIKTSKKVPVTYASINYYLICTKTNNVALLLDLLCFSIPTLCTTIVIFARSFSFVNVASLTDNCPFVVG